MDWIIDLAYKTMDLNAPLPLDTAFDNTLEEYVATVGGSLTSSGCGFGLRDIQFRFPKEPDDSVVTEIKELGKERYHIKIDYVSKYEEDQ